MAARPPAVLIITLLLSVVSALALSPACSSSDGGSADAGPVVPPADANDNDAAPFVCMTVAPSACPDPAPVYADITPIIEERCFACHGGATENWPLRTYPHVAAWYAEIRGAMLDCSMPPQDSGLTMTNAERQHLLEWIRCGYPAE